MKKHLFEPVNIKGLQLKNRFIRSATWMNAAEEDGTTNEQTIRIYEDLAKGGTGLIVTGFAYIMKEEKPAPNMLGIYDDSLIKSHQVLTDRVHQYDAKIALQIVYGGSASSHSKASEMLFIGPSAVKNNMTGIIPKVASFADFKKIVDAFTDAIVRAKKAGYDAVQLHAAHGYFLSMMLAPYTNRRTDKYGGSIHNRARIIYEIIESAKEKVGPDFPIMIKINHDDMVVEGQGFVLEEAKMVCKRLEELGVALIEISGGNLSVDPNVKAVRQRLKKLEAQSYFADAAKEIASEVSAPVSVVGGHRNPKLLDEILNGSDIEFFSISRPLIAEPDLINQWKDDPTYLPKCISCNNCFKSSPVSCILNKI